MMPVSNLRNLRPLAASFRSHERPLAPFCVLSRRKAMASVCFFFTHSIVSRTLGVIGTPLASFR